jgi:hypothetical protein
MKKEDKDLLFKDLSARLPYHVKVKVWLKDGTIEEGVLDLEHNYADVLLDAFYYNKIKDIKPYLRSMSSMTQTERKYLNDLRKIKFDTYYGYHAACIDYLNSIHVDYNNLIGKDLAIDKENNLYVVITQSILDYIKKNSHNFENPMPTLGEKWIVDGEFTYSGICGGQPVIEIHKTTGEFMRLPKSIIEIEKNELHT